MEKLETEIPYLLRLWNLRYIAYYNITTSPPWRHLVMNRGH